MRYLFDHPGKPAWRLIRLTDPQGKFWYQTGDYEGRPTLTGLADRIRTGALRREDVPNAVIEAEFRGDGHELRDGDGGTVYHTSEGTRRQMLRAFMDGHLRGGGGTMRGLFTFAKEGSRISLTAYTGCIPQGVAAGGPDTGAVPDLTTLMAELPPPRRR